MAIFRYKLLYLIVLLSLGFGSVSAAKQQPSNINLEYWQYFYWSNWSSGPYKIYTTAEVRFNQGATEVHNTRISHSGAYHYRLTGNFAYQALKWLDLEAHYSYIYTKPLRLPHFVNRQRYEFEVNPHLRLSNGIAFKWNNRLELIKRQNIARIHYEFRSGLRVLFPIKNWGPLVSFSVFNQVHYNLDKGKVNQNRFFPAELTFALNKDVSVTVFLLIRDLILAQTWHRSAIIGSWLNF